MEIPIIYILIGAEVLLIFMGLTITLAIILLRRPVTETIVEAETETPEEETEALPGTSYIEYIKQALDRNTTKVKQTINIEADELDTEEDVINLDEEPSEKPQDETAEEKGSEENPDSPPPDELQSVLLQAREQFLNIEKQAAENTEHEINFWESIYQGMQDLVEHLKTIEVITEEKTSTTTVSEKGESKEKVFYIETQGKKIDGEVNRLKDIIYDQENAINSMKNAIDSTDGEFADDAETLEFLKQQLETIERQLSDSKMCMEVLEMENDRLQSEIDQFEAQGEIQDKTDEDESDTGIDIGQMKETLEQQEARIQELLETIESLEIDASQADLLKQTLNDFTRSSQEMMSCITILEEENERLQETANHSDEAEAVGSVENDTSELTSKISGLEEELIKKDVAYAQLQDEFSSMETEYLAMYEAMHGDNS